MTFTSYSARIQLNQLQPQELNAYKQNLDKEQQDLIKEEESLKQEQQDLITDETDTPQVPNLPPHR